jgi:hypothetical protein
MPRNGYQNSLRFWNGMSDLNFLLISLSSLNLFSFVLGMFFASSLWYPKRVLPYIVIYFMGVSLYFYLKLTSVI